MNARTAWSVRLSAEARRHAFAGALISLAAAGCGSRTGLLLDEVTDERPGVPDAGPDVVSPHDAAPDVVLPHDAAPPGDVAIPISPPNTPPACVQLPEPSIFMVSIGANIWQFKPGTNGGAATVSEAGHLDCPTAPTPFAGNCTNGVPMPFSMAVDRTGTAYVIYCDGEVFKVDTHKLSCAALGVVPSHFGMAFSQDATDTNETLYVAEGPEEGTLASINTTTLAFDVIGNFSPTAEFSELTGSGAGDLFLFYSNNGSEMSIAKVDKTTAVLTNILPLSGLNMGGGWAFVFWGGAFYTFTGAVAQDGSFLNATVITQVSPADGSRTTVAKVNDLVVGAGVSTCAPQQ